MAALEPYKRKILGLFDGPHAPISIRSVRLKKKEKVTSLHGVDFSYVFLQREIVDSDPKNIAICDGSVMATFAGVERALHFSGWRIHSALANVVDLGTVVAVFECSKEVISLKLQSGEWETIPTPMRTNPIGAARFQLGSSGARASLVFSVEGQLPQKLVLARDQITGAEIAVPR